MSKLLINEEATSGAGGSSGGDSRDVVDGLEVKFVKNIEDGDSDQSFVDHYRVQKSSQALIMNVETVWNYFPQPSEEARSPKEPEIPDFSVVVRKCHDTQILFHMVLLFHKQCMLISYK